MQICLPSDLPLSLLRQEITDAELLLWSWISASSYVPLYSLFHFVVLDVLVSACGTLSAFFARMQTVYTTPSSMFYGTYPRFGWTVPRYMRFVFSVDISHNHSIPGAVHMVIRRMRMARKVIENRCILVGWSGFVNGVYHPPHPFYPPPTFARRTPFWIPHTSDT